MLVAVPLLVGLVVSRLLAEPFFEVAQRYNPDVFALTDRKKVEGAKEVHKHELRLRMDAAIGRAPPLTEPVLQAPAHRRSCPGRAPAPVGLDPGDTVAGKPRRSALCAWAHFILIDAACSVADQAGLLGHGRAA